MAMEVQNSLAELRVKRGISAARLAEMVGVSRQTIYAIEAATYVPNTVVGLKLAKVLDTPLEQIFQLPQDEPRSFSIQGVDLLPGGGEMHPGQPLRLCGVDGRLVATVPESGTWGLPLADAVLAEAASRRGPARARVVDESWKLGNRLLIAGCDPAAELVARHFQRKGFDLIISYQNSSLSLELLKEGRVHIAGTHLSDKKTGECNLPCVARMFGKRSVAVIAFAAWEEGIVVAHGNPKKIVGIAELGRRDVRITNREKGAGCRLLLDSLLHAQDIDTGTVKGYERIAFGHLPAARQVLDNQSDACISTRAAAQALGLDFIPLTTKRYDLVIRRCHLKLPQIQALIEMLGRTSFRQEMETATSYDMRASGDRLL